MRITERFHQVKHKVSKRGTCTVCGRSCTRQMTVMNTVNPFNRDASGRAKSYDEVRADVKAEAQRWKTSPIVCVSCEEAAKQEARGT
jgi:hypothetical protein